MVNQEIVERAKAVLEKARRGLGEDFGGSRIDLLLDNIPELKGVEEARFVLHHLEGH